MPRPSWIKLWTEEWLDGSVRAELEPDERSIFLDLLALAGRSRQPGVIQRNPNTPFSHSAIAARLQVPVDLLKRALTKCITQDRLSENSDGIHVVNWNYYQALYTQKRISRETNEAKDSSKETKVMSDEQKHLFDILLKCPAIKPGDAWKLPELLGYYPGRNYESEFRKFVEWWPGPRGRKKPWLVLRNWLEKAPKEPKPAKPGWNKNIEDELED